MTVRQRLLASAALFLTAAAFVGTARAQVAPGPRFPQPDPLGRPPLPPDQVKARIEQFLNGDPRGLPPAKLPFDLTPEKLAELGKILTGNKDGKTQKISPEQEAAVKRLKETNPEFFKQLQELARKGQPGGPFDPNPGKGPRPNPPDPKVDDGKLPPFKVDAPGKRPPDVPPMPPVGPRPVPPQPRPPIQKDDVAPPDPRVNPPAPRDPKKVGPWETPESPQEKARQAAAAMWEKNVGPLDETPAVKKALFDLADGSFDLKDPDGNNLWETFGKEFGDGKGLGDLFDGFDGDGFKFGDNFDFPKLNWNFNFNWGNSGPPKLDPGAGAARESWWSRWRRSSSTPSSPSSSGSSWFSGWKAPKWNIGVPALDGTWLPVVFLVAALVGGFFLWRYLARRLKVPDNRIDPYALGPWPVDPFHLASRQDVVVAFEHLSVLVCGEVAKTWTHTTIAGALSELAMAEPQRAMLLARLYELARYTPADEPLTTAELAEARRIVCKLAGFSDD